MYKYLLHILFCIVVVGCQFRGNTNAKSEALKVKIYQTSVEGDALTVVDDMGKSDAKINLTIKPEETFQTITGFGGSFTESSAYLLNKLSAPKRTEVLNAYFSPEGSNYTLTRTHMNSCDFSVSNYSYAPVADDLSLENFSIQEDRDDIIPMIKDAMRISQDGFKIISSPWTAPPWMKDNKDWKGGKLLPKYYDVWALFFSKYIDAYKKEGIDIWGLTVENEPLGNDSNWESMHYSPDEMTEFVQYHLGPGLDQHGFGGVQLLGFDQNRGDELKHWVDVMYKDEASSKYYDGTAVHWYASTFDFFPASLRHAHNKAPDKHLINTEACADAEVPKWRDDKWYWSREATDWGWDWAPPADKHLHPKYSPVNRYARDIIGCLNNYVDGWVDWNMVLDTKGGTNWAKNWCLAPVIVDPDADDVYYTPMYYILGHFSKFIRPGAKRIGWESNENNLQVTAAKNLDGSLAVIVFNESMDNKAFQLSLPDQHTIVNIPAQAIQTILIAQ